MAIALVATNNVAVEADATGSTLDAPAFGVNITSGNFLIAATSWDSAVSSNDDATITDTAGNTWTRVPDNSAADKPSYDGTDGGAITIYYAQITLGGGTKPTVTAHYWTNSTHNVTESPDFRAIHVSEWSGVATSTPLDGTNYGSNLQTIAAGGTDIAFTPAANITPSVDGCLLYGYTAEFGGGFGQSALLSAGTSFTELNKVATVTPAGYYYETEYFVQTPKAAIKARWTLNPTGFNSESCLSLMATFKPSGGAADTLMGQIIL